MHKTNMDAKWLAFLPHQLRTLVSGRHVLQGIVGNSGWLFAEKLCRMGVGLVVAAWLARYLGPKPFGTWNYAVAVVSLFAAMATLGLDGIVVRDLVRRPHQQYQILSSAFALKLLGAVCATAGSQFAIFLMRPDDQALYYLVSIIALGLVFQAFDVVDFWFQARVQSRYAVYARSMAFFALSGVRILLIVFNASLPAFAWASVAEVAITAAGFSVAFKRAGGVLTLAPAQWSEMKSLLTESWPLMLSGLAVMIYMRIDQIMLAEMVGEGAVGIYSAALKLSEFWYSIPIVIVASVMPSLTDTRARSSNQYYRRLHQLFRGLVAIAYLVAIPICLTSNQLVTWLFGEPFAAAGPVLAVHIWTSVFVFLGVALSPWIVNEHMTTFSLFQTLLGAVCNILANCYLIPSLGALGAAIATLLSQILATYVALVFWRKTRQVFRMQTMALLLQPIPAEAQ